MITSPARVFNLGSINIDHVYEVPHFVRPGETIPSTAYRRGAGGKGFNQSIALARAGQAVTHIGAIGSDSEWLRAILHAENIDTRHVRSEPIPTGHAIIQVVPSGENSIVLHAGANHSITAESLRAALAEASANDWFLTQNETSHVAAALSAARAAGLRVCFNPAPFTPAVRDYPLDCVDLLVINETEGKALADATDPAVILDRLIARWPQLEVVLTLGGEGAVFARGTTRLTQPALPVNVVDTTAAGDTFLGYLIASLIKGLALPEALARASRAAGIAIARPGAADSIPRATEVTA